jgi:hypothetical protein
MKSVRNAFYFALVVVLFNACKKEYSLEGGGLKNPSGSWEFKDGSSQFSGNMDTAYITSSGGTGTKELQLIGTSADGSQTFHMHLFADTFKTGTYKASLFQSSFEYTSGGKILYQAGQLIGEFIVNVTSYGNNFIGGTFSGEANDSVNNIKNLTEGKFSSIIGGVAAPSISVGVFGDSSGSCKPVTLAGTYAQDIALTADNTVQVQVVVATEGTYSISSNNVNGVSFSKTGTFTNTGVQSVVLNGTGTPTGAGDQTYIIKYGNSQCSFKINFAAPATGTTGGTGGDCTPFSLSGNYQQGILLNISNTVQIEVNVLTTGGYNITTNSVNGVSFSKSGLFTTTGVQSLTLTGSGTPINAGEQTYTVSFGVSSCDFKVTFLPGVMPSGDYFPVTVNSNWTYSLAGGSASDDVHLTVLAYSPMFGTETYKTLAGYDVPPTTAFDSLYYRKPGGDYYQYINYSDLIPFDGPALEGEFIFLKDNVDAGNTWQSPVISGAVQGIPISLTIKMTLLEKAVPVTIGTFNFPDVVKVKYEYEYAFTGIPTIVETDERWFARNVGEIHDSYNDGVTTTVYDINDFRIF